MFVFDVSTQRKVDIVLEDYWDNVCHSFISTENLSDGYLHTVFYATLFMKFACSRRKTRLYLRRSKRYNGIICWIDVFNLVLLLPGMFLVKMLIDSIRISTR